MYLIGFLIFCLAGCWILYLSQAQQACLSVALPARTGRTGYLLSQAMALFCITQQWSLLCSFFAWLVLTMLSFSCLPFLSLFTKKS